MYKDTLPHLYLVFQLAVWILLKENLIGSHVECWDNFLWVADELSVQFSIKSLQMAAVNIQKGSFK